MQGNSNQSQPLLTSARGPKKSRSKITLISVAVVFVSASLYLASLIPSPSVNEATVFSATSDKHDFGSVKAPGISDETFNHGLDRCKAIERRKQSQESSDQRTHNPRAVPGTAPMLIRNGYIWVGDSYLENHDILVENGVIQKVAQNIETLPEYHIIDAKNRVVTPGIVDMHSHLGLDSLPMLAGTTDTNEGTSPTTPYVRALEGFNPSDPALPIVLSGGVTTSLILPGSGNSMGGEALAVKLRPVSTLSVEDMQVFAGSNDSEEKIWRYMKMACGENPKRFYGGVQNTMPSTRMGEGYLFRKWFQDAFSLKNRQEDWCAAAEELNATDRHLTRLSTPFPESIELESLVALLRGDTKLNVHCYEPHDLEAMVRHSHEFNFDIAAFHHALKAWKVPEIIKRAKGNVTIATFSDMWGYKFEAMDGNVRAPQILEEAGIPVALKTDHPVLTAQDLAHEAAKSYHYGLAEHKALKSITSIPAAAMGLSHRVGSIAPGMDADIVIWERHPLRLGARPDHVIVDGIEQHFNSTFNLPKKVLSDSKEAVAPNAHASNGRDKNRAPIGKKEDLLLEDHGSKNPVTYSEACSSESNSFVLRNIGKLFLNRNDVFENLNGQSKDDELYVVVENGTIVCSGKGCGRDKINWPDKSAVFDLNGGYVLPGLISTGARIGLVEIIDESSTHDGVANNDLNDAELHKTITRAVDGLKFGTEHLSKPYKAGVLYSVTQPIVMGDKVVAGVSTAFKIGAENTVLDAEDIILQEEAALHFVLTVEPKPAKSEQIAGIRRLLASNLDKDTTNNVFARAAKGQLPVVIQTDDKDEIAQIIKMKKYLRSLEHGGDVHFVILGGAEAWLVAEHLAAENIPVILAPPRCRPLTWGMRHCLSGKPMQDATGLDVLVAKGVLVGVASLDADDGYVRNLIWDAGWNLATNSKLTDTDAVGFVTWNIADIFGLRQPNGELLGVLSAGQPAELVAYDGNPFEFGTKVQLVAGGGRRGVICQQDVEQM
ncbi:hypothetical protein NQZ79_g901 [Umbelopsis isabellina]|nr:hypothetical protein NQZ79_g901 [Umbelopsis isabellina]